jgi:DNA-directed RNA polymerase specialized sigma24 family protein
MGRPQRILSWWDREVDCKGRQIRGDVRSAAHEVWKEACRRTRSLLADPAQAADVMEDSVAQVSRYLDRIGAPSSPPKNGLLLLAFSRVLRRLAAKSRRLEPAGGAIWKRLFVDSAKETAPSWLSERPATTGRKLPRHSERQWLKFAMPFGAKSEM